MVDGTPDMYLLIVYVKSAQNITLIGTRHFYLFDDEAEAEHWKKIFEIPLTGRVTHEAEVKKLAVNQNPVATEIAETRTVDKNPHRTVVLKIAEALEVLVAIVNRELNADANEGTTPDDPAWKAAIAAVVRAAEISVAVLDLPEVMEILQPQNSTVEKNPIADSLAISCPLCHTKPGLFCFEVNGEKVNHGQRIMAGAMVAGTVRK